MGPITGTFLVLVGAAIVTVLGYWAFKRLGNYFGELMDENSDDHAE